MLTKFLCLLVIIFTAVSAPVSALSAADRQSLNTDTVYLWPTQVAGTCTGDPAAGAPTALTGSDNFQKAFNFFIAKGLTPIQAAGFVGNLMGEDASLAPNRDELKGFADTPTPGDGFGIAQWTSPGRQKDLVTYATNRNTPVADLGIQLAFAWLEYTTNSSYSADYAALRKATTIEQAVHAVMDHYEAPLDPVKDFPIRVFYAQHIFNLYGDSAGNTGTVVTNCSGSGTVNCNVSSGTSASGGAGLSQTRQQVVCIAEAQLKIWEAQVGYPHPAYSRSGYLIYSQNNPEEWCADFASWVYNQANYPLKPGANWRIPGVKTIQAIGEAGGNFQWHPIGSGYIPRPGDLAIHGGNHVNIFISASGNVTNYIGGDQGDGPYPGGSIVSVATYHGYWGDPTHNDTITGYVTPD